MVSISLFAALGGGVFWFRHTQSKQNQRAQQEMFHAVYHFETSCFDKALHGDGTHAGFLHIIEDYPLSQAANLARFYAGVSCMHQKDYMQAVQHLRKFKAKDMLLQARAWAVMGDAYTEQEDYEKASAFYLKAAEYRTNLAFSPIYLMKAGLAYEASHQLEQALRCYDRVLEDFAKSEYGLEACKRAALVSTLLEKNNHSA